MHSSYQLLIIFFSFTVLFWPTTTGQYPAEPNNITREVKRLLINEGDRLTENYTNGPLIPSDDIVGQIINLLNCGSFPHQAHSHLKYSLDYATKNLRVFQICDRYYKTSQNSDSLQVECKYKNWIFNKINCQKITCPRLAAPTDGHISTTDNTYNTTVYFWCSRGFSINGTDKLFCEENGLWNLQPPTCNVSYCRPLLPPHHGFVSSQEETAVNRTVVFTCEREYSLIGDAVLRCDDNGRWNNSAPVCKKVCIVPDMTSQFEGIHLLPEFNVLSNGSLVQQGQRVLFACKSGYMTLSSEISNCINGAWVPAIQCRKLCTPVEIANGIYFLSKDSSTVEYSCASGYHLIGQRKLSCMPNVTWDSETPTCAKMCTLLERPNVLSYRNKESYEIIPYGTQIVNETQVYAVCRDNPSFSTNFVQCINGEPSNTVCNIKLERRLLQIFYMGRWHSICKQSTNVCSILGFKAYGNKRCSGCSSFDTESFKISSQIFLSRIKTYGSDCWGCGKN